MPDRYPLTAQTLYADLLSRVQDQALVGVAGTPTLRDYDGRAYWYARERVGERMVERYLGPDGAELRERIEHARGRIADLKSAQGETARMVRQLREAGFPSPDAETGKVLLALAKAGVFRLRALLVGSHAFRCYPAMLGVPLPAALAVTEDIDLAQFSTISLAIGDGADPGLGEALTLLGYEPRPSPRSRQQSSSWRASRGGTAVELLTPLVGPERGGLVLLPALRAYAQPLRFLDYLIYESLPAVLLYRSGVLVNVPRPERYAVHKLIVATRRRGNGEEKAQKDLAQAASLIAVLAEDRPEELAEAYEEAERRGSAWAEALRRARSRLEAPAKAALDRALA